MAISGKSFAALCDHFPEELPKVLDWFPSQWNQLARNTTNKTDNVGDFSWYDLPGSIYLQRLFADMSSVCRYCYGRLCLHAWPLTRKPSWWRSCRNWSESWKKREGWTAARIKDREGHTIHAVPSRLLEMLNLGCVRDLKEQDIQCACLVFSSLEHSLLEPFINLQLI